MGEGMSVRVCRDSRRHRCRSRASVLVICVLLVLFCRSVVAQDSGVGSERKGRLRSVYGDMTTGPVESRYRFREFNSSRQVSGIEGEREGEGEAAGDAHAKPVTQAEPGGHDLYEFAHDEHGLHESHGSHGGQHGEHHISVPPMMGSVSVGPSQKTLRFPIDRLILNPTQFTIPGAPAGSPLSLSQPGPFNILDPTGAATFQQLQQFHRLKFLAIPPANIVGSVSDTAVLNTALTVAEINAAFAATLQPYDLIAINAPPGSYSTAVVGVFGSRTLVNGQTAFDPSTSGALRSFGTENQPPINGPLLAGNTLDAFYAFDFVTTLAVPTPGGDGLIGRSNVATTNTPLPTNRLYFDYSLMSNAVPTNRSGSLDRFTFGFERAINVIFEGRLSVEARFPFAASLDNQISIESGMGSSQVEMGNALLILKYLISSSENFAMSGGLGVSAPTGSDIAIGSLNGNQFLKFNNDSSHLKPFLAFAYVPDGRFFTSGFVEYDTPAGSNQVMLNLDGRGLRNVGNLRDASHLLVDLAAGYWIGSPDDHGLVRRWAPTMQLHYDRGLGDTSVVKGPSYRLLDISDNRELLNLLVGATLDLDRNRYLSFGYVTGIGGDGSASEGEFRAMLNLPFNAK